MKVVSTLALVGALFAVLPSAHALEIDFGETGAPEICAAGADGLGDMVACANFSFINQDYGDIDGVLDVAYWAPERSESLQWWATDFNNLYGIARAGGSPAASTANITLSSLDPAQGIFLETFKLGAYPNAIKGSHIQIFDLADNSLRFVDDSVAAGGQQISFNLWSSKGFLIEWYDSANDVGIDNIVFSVTAVPEPETYAMMLAGLGLVGAFARRTRR